MSARAAGKFSRRVMFQQRPIDPDTGETSEWVNIIDRAAEIVPLVGGEEVKEQRLTGYQPVVIKVDRDVITREIDGAWRAYDYRRPAPPSPSATIWGVKSAIWKETDNVMEILAVEQKSGANG